MYNNIDVDKKVEYLKKIGYDYIDKDELYDFIEEGFNDASDLEWVQLMLTGVDLNVDYFIMVDNSYPSPLYDKDIDRTFNDNIETIKSKTNFLTKYPEYNQDQSL